jgi:Protein of unknown function (DUF3307)
MISVFVLLVVYQLKHFLADFPLQTPYMLKKFLPGREFIKPLAAHCAVHAGFTVAIAAGYSLAVGRPAPVLAVGLGVLDFVVHFTMDRIKASPAMLGRYKAMAASEFKSAHSVIAQSERPGCHHEIVNAARMFKDHLRSNKYFWWALGLDQMVHHLTHYAIIWLLVTN